MCHIQQGQELLQFHVHTQVNHTCVCELGCNINMSFLRWSQSKVFLKVSIVLIPFPVGRWVCACKCPVLSPAASKCSRARVPRLWDLIPDDVRWSRRNKTEIKCTINVMCLTHPETLPPDSLMCGKIVFHETSPW